MPQNNCSSLSVSSLSAPSVDFVGTERGSESGRGDDISPLLITAVGGGAGFTVEREALPSEAGIKLTRLVFRFSAGPMPVLVEWRVPLVDIAGKWHCVIGSDRSLTADWVRYLESYATLNAPVICAFSSGGANRLTFAVSDAVNPLKLQAQVEEDTAELRCRVVLFDAPMAADTTECVVVLRRDRRDVAYHRALADVARWWEAMPEYRPAAVPEAGFEPVYSTWYGFHQKLTPEEIEEECLWAKKLGCGAVIVDDGWQCDDNNKGYDYCGDWEVARGKFPDFAGHVARVQAMGMKYLLWYSVPYAGLKSVAWARFQDRMLLKPFANAACFDPRYREVRDYLVGCYQRAVEEWGVDGLKLDFVDRFTAVAPGESREEVADMVSVPAAADRLLTDVITTLRKTRPDVLVEFRQRYIGPAMRKYGNLFRASDCPNDGWSNRVRTLDVRLLAAGTAVHSDMIMWHPDESTVRVALQLWAALFSVPQISVRRAMIKPEQERALGFFLRFWREHRDLLLAGELEPLFPMELYPVVQTRRGKDVLVACYADRVVALPVPPAGGRLLLVNATESERVVVECARTLEVSSITTFNCLGVSTVSAWRGLSGVCVLAVPAAGVCVLTIGESVIS